MTKRVFYLDFIRAISICMIIVDHYNWHALELGVADRTVFWEKSIFLWDYTFLGVLGVSLFIILSGASLMLSTKEELDLKIFFKKRFFSIYPLFWLTYAVVFVIFYVLYKRPPADAHPSALLLTFLGLDGFLLYKIPNFYLIGEWFLGFIIILYLGFPLLRYIFLRYQLLTILICILITLSVNKYYHGTMDILRFPLSRLLEFFAGMCFIYLFAPSRKWVNLTLFWISGVVLYLTIGLNIPLLLSIPLDGICVFTCLACIADLLDKPIFETSVKFVSDYSYGAFLIHHFLFLRILPLFANKHLTLSVSYALFSMLLVSIYVLSYFLTNAAAFGVKKVTAISLATIRP